MRLLLYTLLIVLSILMAIIQTGTLKKPLWQSRVFYFYLGVQLTCATVGLILGKLFFNL